jgi:hypothetical protein
VTEMQGIHPLGEMGASERNFVQLLKHAEFGESVTAYLSLRFIY